MRGTIDHVWENETKGGQKYLTVQMNGERYSGWNSKYFDSIQEGATVDYGRTEGTRTSFGGEFVFVIC